ncbi:hypothetical protein MOQ_009987 [Trypanosoma cruzi marinkellei]|uniref:PX domain-containing protein n=1 Tax=Trypanosoma cruzi marinkellei TaxID=85056 RepID=K2MV78_TRYCR|nr:hypothetical protein MOQ_009987 [Trypanosoma cruzi marinkellei]
MERDESVARRAGEDNVEEEEKGKNGRSDPRRVKGGNKSLFSRIRHRLQPHRGGEKDTSDTFRADVRGVTIPASVPRLLKANMLAGLFIQEASVPFATVFYSPDGFVVKYAVVLRLSDGRRLAADRRYSDLLSLHHVMKKLHFNSSRRSFVGHVAQSTSAPPFPHFPGRGIMRGSKYPTITFLLQRRRELNEYFRVLTCESPAGVQECLTSLAARELLIRFCMPTSRRCGTDDGAAEEPHEGDADDRRKKKGDGRKEKGGMTGTLPISTHATSFCLLDDGFDWDALLGSVKFTETASLSLVPSSSSSSSSSLSLEHRQTAAMKPTCTLTSSSAMSFGVNEGVLQMNSGDLSALRRVLEPRLECTGNNDNNDSSGTGRGDEHVAHAGMANFFNAPQRASVCKNPGWIQAAYGVRRSTTQDPKTTMLPCMSAIPTLLFATSHAKMYFDTMNPHCLRMVVVCSEGHEYMTEVMRRRDALVAFYTIVAGRHNVDMLPSAEEADYLLSGYRRHKRRGPLLRMKMLGVKSPRCHLTPRTSSSMKSSLTSSLSVATAPLSLAAEAKCHGDAAADTAVTIPSTRTGGREEAEGDEPANGQTLSQTSPSHDRPEDTQHKCTERFYTESDVSELPASAAADDDKNGMDAVVHVPSCSSSSSSSPSSSSSFSSSPLQPLLTASSPVFLEEDVRPEPPTAEPIDGVVPAAAAAATTTTPAVAAAPVGPLLEWHTHPQKPVCWNSVHLVAVAGEKENVEAALYCTCTSKKLCQRYRSLHEVENVGDTRLVTIAGGVNAHNVSQQRGGDGKQMVQSTPGGMVLTDMYKTACGYTIYIQPPMNP